MILRFADCTLDTDRQALSRGGAPVPVEPQVFDLIRLLAENADRLVTRDEIVDAVWGGRAVSESAISARIASARKAVGDDGQRQAVIRTVQRRGLQMAVPVSAGAAAATPSPAAAAAKPKIRYATAGDGTTLAYAVGGSGPPVAVVSFYMTDIEKEMHWPGLHEDFDAIMEQNTLLRVDQRGAGLSRRPLESLDLDTFAEDMRAVLDAAGIERTAILAKSAGAMTALTFARKYPERVDRMLIVGGYVDGRVRRTGRTDPAPDAIRTILEEGWTDPQSIFMSAYMTAYFPEGPEEVSRSLAEYVQANTSQENILLFRDMVDRASVADCLEHIACPVLVIHSRNNRIHPLSEGQKLAAGIRQAEMMVLESANELPLFGHPSWESYLSAVLAFLRG